MNSIYVSSKHSVYQKVDPSSGMLITVNEPTVPTWTKLHYGGKNCKHETTWCEKCLKEWAIDYNIETKRPQ